MERGDPSLYYGKNIYTGRVKFHSTGVVSTPGRRVTEKGSGIQGLMETISHNHDN